MPHSKHYPVADSVITHMNTFISGLPNSMLASRYAGLVAVAGCGVYELAIKKLLMDFAKTRDSVFCNYLEVQFDKLNAKIRLPDLKKQYLKKFGNKYADNFQDLVDFEERKSLQQHGISIVNSYTNIIQWRHDFAHSGRPPQYASYNEVVKSYNAGKTILDCFYVALL